MPDNTVANIDRNSWQLPPVFQWLQSQGNISDAEMLKTFNCGVGMVVVVDANEVDSVLSTLSEAGEQAWQIGTISSSDGEAVVQYNAVS